MYMPPLPAGSTPKDAAVFVGANPIGPSPEAQAEETTETGINSAPLRNWPTVRVAAGNYKAPDYS